MYFVCSYTVNCGLSLECDFYLLLLLSQFFERQGVASSPGWEALFNDLTGLQLAGLGKDFLKSLANHLAATQDFEASREWLSFGESRRDFAFDFFFEATRKEEEEEVAVSSSSVPPVSNCKSKTGRE